MALQSQDFQVTSPASGSPLPISGTDPVPHGIHSAATNAAGGPNTVLRVIVESLLYPVSLDILHQIFQRFGKVLKIVTFNKNNSFQVSIGALGHFRRPRLTVISSARRRLSSIQMPRPLNTRKPFSMARTFTTAVAHCASTTAN